MDGGIGDWRVPPRERETEMTLSTYLIILTLKLDSQLCILSNQQQNLEPIRRGGGGGGEEY